MKTLTQRLDIDCGPILVEPTCKREAMRANSSFEVQSTGVIDAPLTRETTLSKDERQFIERHCNALYEQVHSNTMIKSSST